MIAADGGHPYPHTKGSGPEHPRTTNMKVIDGLQALEPPLARSVLTIGNFDGVHRAHQQILAQAGLFAANTGGPVVVLTLEPHPLTVVAPDRAPRRLSTPEEKLRCLAAAGVDLAVVARSEPELLGLEAEVFIRRVIWDRFHPTHVVEGPSFGFGRGRRGTPQMLERAGVEFGFEVHILGSVTLELTEGETLLVSSSLIRKLLEDGDVRRAALCLGRPYALSGEVVHGDGRGATIGFPTANVAVADQLIPADGVYAGRTIVDDHPFLSGISIGHTPTFGGTQRQIETHLLGFDGWLYGRRVRVEFERHLRLQRKFPSAAALAEQVTADIAEVRRCLQDAPADTTTVEEQRHDAG
jgi:riboflavin kinase/FMN adenylyltransferase